MSEHWSNDSENSALHYKNKLKTDNLFHCNNNHKFTIFDQTNDLGYHKRPLKKKKNF